MPTRDENSLKNKNASSDSAWGILNYNREIIVYNICMSQSKSVSMKGEKIVQGIWKPDIFNKYRNKIGIGATTKPFIDSIVPERKGLAVLRVKGNDGCAKVDFQCVNDEEERKKAADKVYKKFIGILDSDSNYKNIIRTKLVHGTDVFVVDFDYLNKIKNKDYRIESAKIVADGIITDLSHMPIIVLAADCAPVAIYDPKNNAVGIFHSGWRGSAGLNSRDSTVVLNGVKKMIETYGSRTEDLVVAIGPHIDKKHFYVDKKGYNAFCNAKDIKGGKLFSQRQLSRFFKINRKRYYVDHGLSIKISLENIGVKSKKIFLSKISTYEMNNLFSSETKEGSEKRDTFVLSIILKKSILD